jgi:hypothetical protein
MKFTLLSLCFLLNHSFFAQKSDSLAWVKQIEYQVDENATWAVDIFGNVYFTKGRVLQKFDSLGVLKFSQSIKSVGNIKDIMPVNTMKLVLFSEEQQVLCLLDNTLTMSENYIELSDFKIGIASLAAVSSQPDKIWLLDQLNSRLLLLDLSGKMQYQEVRNLNGVLNLSDITSLNESEGHLYLMSNQTLYEFDVYGSLINELTFTYNSLKTVAALPFYGKIFWFTSEAMIVKNFDEGKEMIINLPITGIISFKKSGEYYYFKTADKILKYSLESHE